MEKIEIGRWLLKKSQSGSIDVWYVLPNTNGEGYINYHGKIDGKLVETPFNYSLKQILKKYEDKINDGYRMLPLNATIGEFIHTLTTELKDKNDNTKPMKAQPYTPGCLRFPLYVQPKINGVRCVAKWSIKKGTDMFDPDYEGYIFTSKEGGDYNVPHLTSILNGYAAKGIIDKNLVFDGELYIPYVKVATIHGAAVNSQNLHHPNLSFIIFDLSMPQAKQSARLIKIADLAKFSKIGFDTHDEAKTNHSVYFLETLFIRSEDEVIPLRDKAIAAGYEGIILRDTNATYGFGQRVSTMRKLKKELYGIFKIHHIQPNDTNGLPIFVLYNDLDSQLFNSSCDGSHAEQRKLLKHAFNYIGKTVKLKYYERTINNLPFHTTAIISSIK